MVRSLANIYYDNLLMVIDGTDEMWQQDEATLQNHQ
jgi:hypothetical protein